MGGYGVEMMIKEIFILGCNIVFFAAVIGCVVYALKLSLERHRIETAITRRALFKRLPENHPDYETGVIGPKAATDEEWKWAKKELFK